MAGHSKWANIQHRKGKQDKLRSKLFSKLAKEITVAAKMGDPDPDKNPRLRLAVKEARSTFGKNGGNLGETNSVAFQFERKGEIFYAPSAGDADTVMMAALDAGAEDV